MPAVPPDPLAARRQAVGEHIRHLRLRANLTQEEVVRRSGIHRNTYLRIERGETDARLSWLLRVADAIGVPAEQLLAADDGPPAP